jgi:RNA polymerase sigma-70 factor (ECF subfamily)
VAPPALIASSAHPRGTAVSDFDEFYAVNFRRVTAQLYAYCGDMSEAQDMAQEAFCRALARWKRISVYDDPSAWVRKVAWNLATSRWRQRRTAQQHLVAQRETYASPPSPDRVALSRALSTLPANQRRAVVLYYLADMSVADIAGQEDSPEGTIRALLHRGRAALAAQLSDVKL